jgi:hypothetical protein
LFKRSFGILADSVASDPELSKQTPRHIIRKACLARNSLLTYGGKTPIELAFGRRPRDIVDVENANPQQLGEPTPERMATEKLMKLAMQAHMEARQAHDLRRDIAAGLKFSTGPFLVGDKVWYWYMDPSVIGVGRKLGKWVRGKVVSVEGPMVTVDLGNRILRTNQSS